MREEQQLHRPVKPVNVLSENLGPLDVLLTNTFGCVLPVSVLWTNTLPVNVLLVDVLSIERIGTHSSQVK